MKISRIHCSYHKCMTVYFKKVFANMQILNPSVFRKGYWHFNSHLEEFYASLDDYKICSINNHYLDLDRLGEYRITRFIRDPRDLVVSGYHYHKRGSEAWCNIPDPTEQDLLVVNGVIPHGISPGMTYAEYLNSIDEVAGMIAELEFRKRHFESMLRWPDNDKKILLLKYEHILNHEADAFRRIFDFYELTLLEKLCGKWLAKHNSLEKKAGKMAHIRKGTVGQWRSALPSAVEHEFLMQYPDLLEKYGYA